MYQFNRMNSRPISLLSNTELELQKNKYSQASRYAILGIKKLLCDLFDCGIDVRLIHNYENSPCLQVFPESVDIITGAPWKYDAVGSEKDYIPVAWEFWRNDVVQHVLEPEVV